MINLVGAAHWTIWWGQPTDQSGGSSPLINLVGTIFSTKAPFSKMNACTNFTENRQHRVLLLNPDNLSLSSGNPGNSGRKGKKPTKLFWLPHLGHTTQACQNTHVHAWTHRIADILKSFNKTTVGKRCRERKRPNPCSITRDTNVWFNACSSLWHTDTSMKTTNTYWSLDI